MTSLSLNQALGWFLGSDSRKVGEADAFLRRYFKGAALHSMVYTTKSGEKGSLPPVGTEEQAKDLASDMLGQISRSKKLPAIPFAEQSRYVMRMFRNLRLKLYREEQREQRSTKEYLGHYRALQDSEEERRRLLARIEGIRQAATGLLRKALDALIGSYLHGFTYAELATRWGVSEQTVKSWVRRYAIPLLRGELGS